MHDAVLSSLTKSNEKKLGTHISTINDSDIGARRGSRYDNPYIAYLRAVAICKLESGK